jgi:ComF family protein
MRCVRCGLKNACDCHLTEWTIDRTLVLTSYEAPIDSLIAELKFQSKQSIGKVLGDLMGREFADQLESERFDRADFCIVPVPLSAARFRQRGFNQAHTISKAVSRQLTIPIRHLVQRRRHQQSQSLLDREQRLANLNHAYELLGVPPDKVILIDDVMTTGATLNQCAALLKSAGTTHVWAMIAARTERPSTEVRR